MWKCREKGETRKKIETGLKGGGIVIFKKENKHSTSQHWQLNNSKEWNITKRAKVREGVIRQKKKNED